MKFSKKINFWLVDRSTNLIVLCGYAKTKYMAKTLARSYVRSSNKNKEVKIKKTNFRLVFKEEK